MSPQMAALVALALWAGSTLLLSELRWFRRRPLVERVAPYVVGGTDVRRRGAVMSAASFVQVIGPLARTVGERVARADFESVQRRVPRDDDRRHDHRHVVARFARQVPR